jgi:hypothetical protein
MSFVPPRDVNRYTDSVDKCWEPTKAYKQTGNEHVIDRTESPELHVTNRSSKTCVGVFACRFYVEATGLISDFKLAMADVYTDSLKVV